MLMLPNSLCTTKVIALIRHPFESNPAGAEPATHPLYWRLILMAEEKGREEAAMPDILPRFCSQKPKPNISASRQGFRKDDPERSILLSEYDLLVSTGGKRWSIN